MQSQNIDGDIVKSVMLNRQEDIVEAIRDAEENLGAVAHRIGRVPQMGTTVEILGLKYRVTFADAMRGKVRLKLL